jgi:hypothetical protein
MVVGTERRGASGEAMGARSADPYREICKCDYWVAGAEARAADLRVCLLSLSR